MQEREFAERFDLLYHVPRSQVWGGSRGAQSGRVHLHVKAGEEFSAGRIHRSERQALCNRSAWYPRPPMEGEQLCPRCVDIASRENTKLSENDHGFQKGPCSAKKDHASEKDHGLIENKGEGMTATPEIKARLEALRVEIRAERISYGEIAELENLAAYIDPSDVELLEWAGVPEHPEAEA